MFSIYVCWGKYAHLILGVHVSHMHRILLKLGFLALESRYWELNLGFLQDQSPYLTMEPFFSLIVGQQLFLYASILELVVCALSSARYLITAA